MSTDPSVIGRIVHRRILVSLIVLLVAAGTLGVGYGLWYLFLQPAGPAAVADSTLPPVPSSSTASASVGAGGSAGGSGPAAGGSSSAAGAGGIDGTWKVDTSIGSFSDFSGSFVGYRVQEQLATIGANTAVGRTPNVSGSMTISGSNVTAATITADLTSLQSNDQRRDGQLGRQGLQTDTYPTATFTLTAPIALGSVPVDGQTISATASGTLSLHGQTRTVQVPLKARRSGSVIEVTGSLPIVFSDYGIEKPQSFAVLTIADQGTMELQLFFARG